MANERGIRLSDLKVGMVLSKDVLNHVTGEVILRRNTAIDEVSLAELKKYIQSTVAATEERAEEYEDVDVNVESLMALPEADRPVFRAFKESYSKTEDETKAYLTAVDEGKPIVLEDLMTMTNDVLSSLKHRSDLFTFLNCLKRQDDYTFTHCLNVSLLANIFGKWIGLNDDELTILTSGAMLLDIGKFRVDEKILNKKGRLTDEELEEVKKHTIYGYETLQPQPISEYIKISVLQHHERIDGSGYPYGLKDAQINKFAKIIAICDIYDAMVTERPYRPKICPFDVIREFERKYFGKVDTQYLMIFLKNIAYNYLNRKVELSDGRFGEIVFINGASYSSPLVRLEDGACVDLLTDKNVRIIRLL